LYKPYKEEKNDNSKLNLIKEYYRIGRDRYPASDAQNNGKRNFALEALMEFRGDNEKAGPYQ
jgi:hypothetical protein